LVIFSNQATPGGIKELPYST